MTTISLILLVAAFVIFALGAWPLPNIRPNLIALGLACWVLSVLLGGIKL